MKVSCEVDNGRMVCSFSGFRKEFVVDEFMGEVKNNLRFRPLATISINILPFKNGNEKFSNQTDRQRVL